MHRFLPLFIIALLLGSLVAFQDKIKTGFKAWQFRNSPAVNELASKEFIERILLSNGEVENAVSKGVWFNKEVVVPTQSISDRLAQDWTQVLGETTDEKWIEINLSTQRLYAHEGNRIIYDFPVSSGLPWMPTVTGEFKLWAKVRAQRMSGGSVNDGTYYDLPNVPYVMYFHGGYGIHGAYWHNDFGKPRSHGCVNLSIADAEKIFYWANPPLPDDKLTWYHIPPEVSTRVVVHGVTPQP